MCRRGLFFSIFILAFCGKLIGQEKAGIRDWPLGIRKRGSLRLGLSLHRSFCFRLHSPPAAAGSAASERSPASRLSAWGLQTAISAVSAAQRTFMKHTNLCTAAVVLLALAAYAVGASAASSGSDREALEQTGTAIRAAFMAGDLATAMKYHHPDISKALSYNKVLVGRDAVAADLRSTLLQYRLDFVENRVKACSSRTIPPLRRPSLPSRQLPSREATHFFSRAASWSSTCVITRAGPAGPLSAKSFSRLAKDRAARGEDDLPAGDTGHRDAWPLLIQSSQRTVDRRLYPDLRPKHYSEKYPLQSPPTALRRPARSRHKK